MAEITTLLLDDGGILATRGWDRHAHRKCVESLGLDRDESQDGQDTNSLFRRISPRDDEENANRILSAMRHKFGGHAIKREDG